MAALVQRLLLLAVFRRRAALRLDTRALLALCAESLLCPPCAPNLYRKLCDRRGFRDDPVAFAARHLPLDAQRRLHAAIDARIALLAQADEDDHRARDVYAARQRIRTLLP